MKTTIFKVIFAVGALFALANCSKSDDSTSNGQMCSANQVYAQQYGGCLNQGNCAYGQGQMPNGQCVQGTLGGGYNNSNGNCGAGQVYADIGSVTGGYGQQRLTCLPIGTCNQLAQFNQANPNYGFYQSGNQAMCVPAYSGGMYNNGGYNNGGYNNGMNQW